MYAARPTLHNASHTLNTCAHSAVLAHLGQPEVHQLRLAVKQHDVVGLEVAVSVPAKLLRFLCAGKGGARTARACWSQGVWSA